MSIALSVPPGIDVISFLSQITRQLLAMSRSCSFVVTESEMLERGPLDQVNKLLTQQWSALAFPIDGIPFGVTRLIAFRQVVRPEMFRFGRRW
jgi:hypothetical protein